jgi:TrmH family RNA methyltransferase
MQPLDRFVVVLDRPQDPINVGAVVRAVKNMGLSRLRLVRPAPFEREELLRIAHHSEDLLDRIEVFDYLDDALADATYVVGTAAVRHSGHTQTQDVRGLATRLMERPAEETIALLFGTEDDGLDLYALDRCHLVATLPTDAAYPALNLAQSVLLFLYEVRLAARTAPPASPRPGRARPPHDQLERLFLLGEEALDAIGFFKRSPASAMRTLRQIVYRADLKPTETAMLMAIARQMVYVARGVGGGATAPVDDGAEP